MTTPCPIPRDGAGQLGAMVDHLLRLLDHPMFVDLNDSHKSTVLHTLEVGSEALLKATQTAHIESLNRQALIKAGAAGQPRGEEVRVGPGHDKLLDAVVKITAEVSGMRAELLERI